MQVALLTARINGLTEHFKVHKKDRHSRQGLLSMVGRRRRLLEYVKRHDEPGYRKLLDALTTTAPPKDRAVEAARARQRAMERFGQARG